jgi:hypothetical protein
MRNHHQGGDMPHRRHELPSNTMDPIDRFVGLLDAVRERSGVERALKALPTQPASSESVPFASRFINGHAIYCQEGTTLARLCDELTYASQFPLTSFPTVRAFKPLSQDGYAVLVTTFEMGTSQALVRWKQWTKPLDADARGAILRDISALRREKLYSSALLESTADWWVVPSSGRVIIPDPRLKFFLTTDTPLDEKIRSLPLSN